MKRELIYLWIEQDAHACFQRMGFNFSPCYQVKFDEKSEELAIEETGKINVFQEGSIQNVTAIIGENGVGKSTLIQYLTGLSDVPFQKKWPKEYSDWTQEMNTKRSFIAVFKQSGSKEKFKIINVRACGRPIWYKQNRIDLYDESKFNEENYIGQISRICLSNSAYGNGSDENLRSDRIEYATLNNTTLKTLYQDFYYGIFGVQNSGYVQGKVFDSFEKFMAERENEQAFQMFLDLAYYAWMHENKTRFCGKSLNQIAFSIDNIAAIANREMMSAPTNTLTERARKICGKFTDKLASEGFWGVLIYDLIFELAVVYDTFDFKEIHSADDGLKQCEAFLWEQTDRRGDVAKRYYQDAIDEIRMFKKTILEAEKWDNHLPLDDWGRKERLLSTIEGFIPVIESVKKGHSFILKYLKVWNLEMSSGERALLNLMSRLYFVSKIQEFYKYQKTFNWNQNVILLLDEIDLYLHPEWQRRIICDLLSALQQQFKGHYFQVILSSHSPIVLSDVPVENSIFLKRAPDGRVQQENRNIQTFGANIYTLYRDAFFFDDSLAMGEFAQKKINGWIDEMEKGKIDPSSDEAKKIIAMIGEPVIRKKLASLVKQSTEKEQKVQTAEESKTRERMIRFLERQKLEIENQLRMMKELNG